MCEEKTISRFNIKLSFVCNMKEADLVLLPEHINILFGSNGTGKSSIVKALSYHINKEDDELMALKQYSSAENENPVVEIKPVNAPEFSKSLLFDENYVSSFLFKENDVANNTYELFARGADADEDIAVLSPKISFIIQKLANESVSKFCSIFESDVAKYDLQKALVSGESVKKTTVLGKMQKAVSVGNSFNDPCVAGYKPYLINSPTEYPKWITEGRNYLTKDDDGRDICPFCLSRIDDLKIILDKFADEAKSKTVLAAQGKEKFYTLLTQADPVKKDQLTMVKSSSALTSDSLKILKHPFSLLQEEYQKIQDMRTFNLLGEGVNLTSVSAFFSTKKLNSKLIGSVASSDGEKAANEVNDAIDVLLAEAKILDEKMAALNKSLRARIQEKEKTLNDFLEDAGIPYHFDICSDGVNIVTQLKPNESDFVPGQIKSHLSFGEKNVIACILFAIEAASLPDNSLIIFDDPLSSFDNTKKYALLYHLFNKAYDTDEVHGIFENLSKKTILIVTHDFDIVTYAFNSQLGTKRRKDIDVRFGYTRAKVFAEKQIVKSSLTTDIQYCRKMFKKETSLFSRVILLRKSLMLELDPTKIFDDPTYQVISNLLKRRPLNELTQNPDSDTAKGVPLSAESLKEGMIEIVSSLSLSKATTYSDLLSCLSNEKLLSSTDTYSDYEKLLCIRILGDGGGSDLSLFKAMGTTSSVFWKAVNECYHIENDALYMLDSSEFPIMPEFLTNFCNEWLRRAKEIVFSSSGFSAKTG